MGINFGLSSRGVVQERSAEDVLQAPGYSRYIVIFKKATQAHDGRRVEAAVIPDGMQFQARKLLGTEVFCDLKIDERESVVVEQMIPVRQPEI